MKFLRLLAAYALACILVLWLAAEIAVAQGVTVVADKPGWLEFSGQLVSQIVQAVVLFIILPLLGYGIQRLLKLLNIHLSDSAQSRLSQALYDSAQKIIGRLVDPTKPIDINFRSKLVAATVQDAIETGAGEGVTPDALAHLAEAKIATILPPGALNGYTPAGGFEASPVLTATTTVQAGEPAATSVAVETKA